MLHACVHTHAVVSWGTDTVLQLFTGSRGVLSGTAVQHLRLL